MDARHSEARRRLLKALSALPLGWALGGPADASARAAAAGVESLAAAINLLIARLGPFAAGQEEMIDGLAARFVESPAGSQLVTDGGVALIAGVARRLPAIGGQLATLDLAALDEPARAWTLAFIRQLYSFLEVRNRVARQPVFGECLGQGGDYTRPPEA